MRAHFMKCLWAASAAALALACGSGDKGPQARTPASEATTTAGTSQRQPSQGYVYEEPISPAPDQSAGAMPGQGSMEGMGTSGTMGQGAVTDQPGMTGGGDTDKTTDTSKAKTERALNDAEIFAVETAANDGEIEMAELARKQATAASVKDFAQMMLTEHRAAQNKAKQIATKAKITASDNEVSNQLKSDVKSMMNDLRGQKKGRDFDKMYLDHQVKAHQTVLDTIDGRLMPSVSSSELKIHLSDLRTKVSDHLSKVQDLSSKLAQQPAAAVEEKTGKPKAKSEEEKSKEEKGTKNGAEKEKKY